MCKKKETDSLECPICRTVNVLEPPRPKLNTRHWTFMAAAGVINPQSIVNWMSGVRFSFSSIPVSYTHLTLPTTERV